MRVLRRFLITIAYVSLVSILVLVSIVVIHAIRESLDTVKNIVVDNLDKNASQGDLFQHNQNLLFLIPLTMIIIIIVGFIAIYVYRPKR